VKWSSGWRRFNWDLHGALGIWLFFFVLMWGVSGVYLGIPQPFSDFVDYISDPESTAERPGDVALLWLTRLHFGRWRDMPWLKAVWFVLGLIPAVLFVTGGIMWWNRVLRRKSIDATPPVSVSRSVMSEETANLQPSERGTFPSCDGHREATPDGLARRGEEIPDDRAE